MTSPSKAALVFRVQPIDLQRPADQQALLHTLDAYARDPMGGGDPLPAHAREHLVAALQATPHYRGWLAWAGAEPVSLLNAPQLQSPQAQGPQAQSPQAPGLPESGPQPLGLLNSFLGFSTFAAAPLLNVHDIAVLPQARGHGVGRALLRAAEAFARQHGCCKLTLEVLEGNTAAQALYAAEGYAGYALDPQMGRAMFWQKKLGQTKQ